MSPRRPGRPRRSETDDHIAAAALALLREHGPEAVSVSAVAARSGVARTTIYRRFRDRQELLEAALRPVAGSGTPPGSASVTEKVGWLLDQTARVLTEGIGLGGVAAALAGRDPDFGPALRASLEAALAPVRAQVAADMAEGSLTRHGDPDLVLDLILGSYLAEVVRHGSPRPGWRRQVTDLLTAVLSPQA